MRAMEVVVTASGIEQSITSTTVTSTATYCDLICVTTTSIARCNGKPSYIELSRLLSRSLPHRKQPYFKQISNADATPFQRRRNLKTLNGRNKMFNLERKEFARKMLDDRNIKYNLERSATTKIQAVFRGYRSRPKIPGYDRRPKEPDILSLEDLRIFLCELTTRLKLSHIQGLTLKIKKKSSRQRNRINNAAAFRIQKFFKMLTERRKAMLYMDKYLRKKRGSAMYILKRVLIKFSLMVKKQKQYETFKCACCIKIQCRMRKFIAQRRVRLVREMSKKLARENEAAIIIQRSFFSPPPKLKNTNYKCSDVTLSDLVVETEYQSDFEDEHEYEYQSICTCNSSRAEPVMTGEQTEDKMLTMTTVVKDEKVKEEDVKKEVDEQGEIADSPRIDLTVTAEPAQEKMMMKMIKEEEEEEDTKEEVLNEDKDDEEERKTLYLDISTANMNDEIHRVRSNHSFHVESNSLGKADQEILNLTDLMEIHNTAECFLLTVIESVRHDLMVSIMIKYSTKYNNLIKRTAETFVDELERTLLAQYMI